MVTDNAVRHKLEEPLGPMPFVRRFGVAWDQGVFSCDKRRNSHGLAPKVTSGRWVRPRQMRELYQPTVKLGDMRQGRSWQRAGDVRDLWLWIWA
jgi:hypothetical protein